LFHATAPLVKLPPPQSARDDYIIEFDINRSGMGKAELLKFYWPNFRQQYFPDDVELLNIEHPRVGHPNKFRARRILHNLTEDEAVCTCLATDVGFNVALETGRDFKLTGTRETSDGIAGFTMERSPGAKS
jgi:hypothetical protein